MTRSASLTASALVSTTRSTMPSSMHPRAGFCRARGGDDLAREPLRPRGARDRAADQAEADQRDAFEERRRAHLPRHEVAQAVDHEAVGLLGADGHAQRVRQAVIVQRAQHEAALGQERVGVGRGLALGLREMDQDEIRHARRHLQAELGRFPPSASCATSRCAPSTSAHARCPRSRPPPPASPASRR